MNPPGEDREGSPSAEDDQSQEGAAGSRPSWGQPLVRPPSVTYPQLAAATTAPEQGVATATGPAPETDAGPGAGPGAGPDAGPDAEADAGPDAGPDAEADAEGTAGARPEPPRPEASWSPRPSAPSRPAPPPSASVGSPEPQGIPSSPTASQAASPGPDATATAANAATPSPDGEEEDTLETRVAAAARLAADAPPTDGPANAPANAPTSAPKAPTNAPTDQPAGPPAPGPASASPEGAPSGPPTEALTRPPAASQTGPTSPGTAPPAPGGVPTTLAGVPPTTGAGVPPTTRAGVPPTTRAGVPPTTLAGVPPRPTPLPPPRTLATGVPGGSTAGSLATEPSRPTERVIGLPRPLKSRKSRVTIRRFDPWSVFVMTLLLSLFLAVVTIVAAFVLYAVLDMLGVPDSINRTAADVQGGGDVITSGRFLGVAALIAAANVVLLTAFATLGAVLYNVCASFAGGLELTLSED